MNTHYVYRLLDDDGTTIYVGCSGDPMGRLRRHRKRPWGHRVAEVVLSVFDDEGTARNIERTLIDRLRPEFNVTHNPESRRQSRGDNKDVVLNALRENGPMTQTECEEYLRAGGSDHVKSFVGTTLTRLRSTGVLKKVGEVPARKGRWKTATVYGLVEVKTEAAA